MRKVLQKLMLAVAVLLPLASHAQTMYLTVADSTATNSYVPVYGLYVDDFVRCQTIYPASMISSMTGESILGVTYYLSSPASASWGVANFVVNVKEVAATTLTAFEDMSTATTVYTGALDATQTTMEIEFTVPYTYQGGNLLVEIYNTLEGTYKSASFYGINAAGASWQGNNGTSVANITGAARDFIPKTKFMYGSAPTCFKVSNLAVDAAASTPNSLTLTWTDALNTNATYSLYEITSAGNTLIQSGITGTTYTVTGLSANTEYTFAMMTDCGAGDVTDLTGPVTGRTACAAMALPWTCGFEANEIVNTTQATALPWCTSRYVSAGTSGTSYPYSYSSTTYAHGGSRSLYFYGSTSTSYPDTMTFILPQVDVTTYPMNNSRLTFWARMSSTSYNKDVYVGTLTDPTDPSTYTPVGSVNVTGTTNTLYSVPLTTATATAPYVCVTVLKGSGSLYMDDMTLEEMPSCLEVSNLVASNITSSSVVLTWSDDANSSATYSIYNMSDTSLVAGNINDTTYTITGLNSDTEYNFGVQANCPAGDAAFMTVAVRTACANETMPWSENFDNWSAKSPCWSFLSGAYNGGAGAPTTSTSAWNLNTTYGSYITIVGKALTMNLYSSNKYWAVTPYIDITSDAMLSVDVAVSAWDAEAPNYDDNDSLILAVTTDGVNFTTLLAYGNTQLNSLTGTYTTITAPVVGYNGQSVRFAIYGGSTSGTSPYDNRIAIDNVSVLSLAGCMAVTDLAVDSVTATSVFLSWTDTVNSGATYTVYNMADTSVVATNVATTSYEVTSLTASTNYTFGVKANCSATDNSNFAIINARTDCAGGSCSITIVGADSYGDGWNGNTIAVVQNGVQIGTFTLTSGDSGSQTFSVCSGLPVSFSWTVGNYPDEVSFNILDGGNTVVYSVTDGSTLSEGVFYTVASPCPSCIPPVVSLDSIGTDYVAISWTNTAATYNVYLDGVAVATGTSATTYTFTNLDPATTYNVGVVALCSATDTSSMAGGSVATECVPVALPFVETFNPALSTSLNCWSVLSMNTYNTVGLGLFGTSDTALMFSSYYDATDYNQYAFSPEFASNADSLLLDIVYATYGSSDMLWFGYITATDTVWSTTSYTTTDQTDAQHYTAMIPGNAIKIALHYYGDYSYYAWIDSVSVTAATPVVLTMTANLAVNDSTMGTTNPVPGTYVFEVGDTATATAIAADGYHFVHWLVEVAGAVVDSIETNPMSIVIDSMMANMTANVTAVFAADPMATVTLNVNDATMGTVAGAGTFHVGDTVTVTATANDGFHFVNWTDAAAVVSTDNPYTFVISADMTLTANFVADEPQPTMYTVAVTVNNATMGTVSGAGVYAEGSTVNLTATANEGYTFVGWVIDGDTIADNPYSFTITANVNAVAVFAATTGIEDADMANVNVYSADSRIIVKGAEGREINVYDLNGRTVSSMRSAGENVEFRMANTGVYLVKVGNAAAKRVVVIR